MNPVELRRLDPVRNMFRFYVLAIEPDLFGGFRLLRQWGRIGWRGARSKIEHYAGGAGMATRLTEVSPIGALSVEMRAELA